MLIEVHMLKHYPASNLNRDETGAPKTCFFGGVQRGRISSQCLKRAWRTSPLFDTLESKGWRSVSLPDEVVKELSDLPEEVRQCARNWIIEILKGSSKEPKAEADNKEETDENNGSDTAKKEAKQIVFFSLDDVQALAQAFRETWDGKTVVKKMDKDKRKEFIACVQKISSRAITLDIALFGRMVTSAALVNVEAAMQVAHAVSTHAVNMESDYFTAVDDLLTGDENTGAGMIGDIDFDSCCYYQYASLDMDKLKENLKNSPKALEKADELVPVLLRVMAMSNPGGKQNTFAAHVLPDVMLVEFKSEKIPLSYANAFAAPVSRYSRQLGKESADRLAAEVNLMDDCYRLPVTHRAWLALRTDSQPDNCQCFARFDDLTRACAEWAKE